MRGGGGGGALLVWLLTKAIKRGNFTPVNQVDGSSARPGRQACGLPTHRDGSEAFVLRGAGGRHAVGSILQTGAEHWYQVPGRC